MSCTNCWLVVVLAINLFALVNGGGLIGDSQAIQSVGFSRQSSQQANTTDDWYSTRFKIKRYSYVWTIDNFRGTTNETLTSPTFPATQMNDQLRWSIALYPKGNSEQNRGNVSVYLKLNECRLAGRDVRARYKFSIIDQQGNDRYLKDSKSPFKFVTTGGWGFASFITRATLLDTNRGLVPGDKLTIHCEIDALIEPMEYSHQGHQSKAATSELLAHFEQLYDSQQLTDVTISVGDKQFQAHKAILAARSPVFKAMFGHNMKEAQENSIEVADIHPDVFKEVLRFVYTGKSSVFGTTRPIDDLEGQQQKAELVAGLLIASDRYQVEGLASICEQVLSESISLDSAGQLLIFADSYNRPQLKTKVIDFIRSNYRQLFQTNSWVATFKEAPTELILEVNRHIFN